MRRSIWIALLLATCGCRALAPQSVELDDISPRRERRQQQAIEQFEASRSEAEFSAALAHWQQGETGACEERLRGLLARREHRPAALLLAEVKLAAEEAAPAEELLRGLCDAQPADEPGRVGAAVLALRYNQPQLAARLLQAAPADQAASPDRLRTLAVAYYRCGDYAAARAVLEQALALDNSSALAYFLMGCTQSRMGQASAAGAAFEQAARLDARFQPPR